MDVGDITTVGDLLIALSEDNDFLEEYWADPERTVAKTGLDSAKRAVVLGNDPGEILDELQREYPEEVVEWGWRPIRVAWALPIPRPIRRVDY